MVFPDGTNFAISDRRNVVVNVVDDFLSASVDEVGLDEVG